MSRRFETTRWSLVLEAAGSSPGAQEALEALCRDYWFPTYGFIRRDVRDPEKARDLTQAYFVHLLEKDLLKRPDPALGSFRGFLMASLKHFLAHERARERALKRRADNARFVFSLDDAEERLDREPRARNPSAETAFDRRWAHTVIRRSTDRLAEAYTADGKEAVYAALRGYLTGEGELAAYAVVADELGMSEGAIKTAVHRMRQRLGILLREEVAQTVADTDSVDDELRYLLSVVADA